MSCNRKNLYESGYTLAGVLLMIALMSILMAIALPVWDRIKQRENEEELIFRGREYTEAIARYHTKFNSFPPDLETLQKMKYIRKLYKDPMTENGEWKLLHPDSLVETGEAGFVNQPGSGEKDEGEQDNKKRNESKKNVKKEVIPGLGGLPKRDGDAEREEEGEEKSVGPVVGVVSRSKKPSLRLYNGQSSYDKWVFAYVPQQQEQPVQPQPPGKTDPKKKPDKSGSQELVPQKPTTPQEQDEDD